MPYFGQLTLYTIHFQNTLYQNKGYNKVCEDICPLRCTEVTYQLIHQTVVRHDFSAHYATISIFYSSFEVIVYKDVAEFTSEDLFGSIGGILGIFWGTSVISFVEIFQIILYLFYMTVKFLVSKIKREDPNKVADSPKIIMEPMQIENTAEPEPINDVGNNHVSDNLGYTSGVDTPPIDAAMVMENSTTSVVSLA